MLTVLLLLLIPIAVFGPQMWARRVLTSYSDHRDDLRGTGGELARHLVQGLSLNGIDVEATEGGDHYDPIAKKVGLGPLSWQQQSLTALVVASHEVGHAMQDANDYQPFRARTRLVQSAQKVQKVGTGLMMVIPVIAILARSPQIGWLMVVVGLGTMVTNFVVHLVTLPVEWDASFRRALPLLAANRYIPAEDQPAARKILTACALTYAASSLASLLNLWRWLAMLRR